MAEDWGDFFRKHQTFNPENILRILPEEIRDFGEDNEYYVENMLRKEDRIAIAGLTNRLPSRTISLPWLFEVRNTAIHAIILIGGCFGVRKITVYTAVIYVDRFLSSMPKKPRFPISRKLGLACLYLACEQFGGYECQREILSLSTDIQRRELMNMKSSVVAEFEGIVTFVTPIHFIKYFLSKFCKDVERTEYARSKTVEIIMSTLGDVRLMSVSAYVVGAAATLLASNPNILTNEVIKDELINALPQNRLIPLDEVCFCYYRLWETNRHKL